MTAIYNNEIVDVALNRKRMKGIIKLQLNW